MNRISGVFLQLLSPHPKICRPLLAAFSWHVSNVAPKKQNWKSKNFFFSIIMQNSAFIKKLARSSKYTIFEKRLYVRSSWSQSNVWMENITTEGCGFEKKGTKKKNLWHFLLPTTTVEQCTNLPVNANFAYFQDPDGVIFGCLNQFQNCVCSKKKKSILSKGYQIFLHSKLS